jgi:hypothetical protein
MSDILLADIIAGIHLGYVLFVLVGFVLIVLGIVLKWGWIRNLWFRIIHLAAIVAVALEALLGVDCPLTVLEFELRYGASQSGSRVSFVGSIIDSLLFYDAPLWVFTIIYSLFALLVALVFVMAPPSRKTH